MQSILNLFGYTVNSILLLITVILLADILIRNSIKKSGRNINEVPTGPLIRDLADMVIPIARKIIKIEDEGLLEKVTIAIAVVIFVLIKIFVVK